MDAIPITTAIVVFNSFEFTNFSFDSDRREFLEPLEFGTFDAASSDGVFGPGADRMKRKKVFY